jgi:hypothetical protein
MHIEVVEPALAVSDRYMAVLEKAAFAATGLPLQRPPGNFVAYLSDGPYWAGNKWHLDGMGLGYTQKRPHEGFSGIDWAITFDPNVSKWNTVNRPVEQA